MLNKIRQYFTSVSILIMFLITLILSLIFGISDGFGNVFYDYTSIFFIIILFTFPIGTTIIEFLLTLLNILRKPPLLNKYLHPIFEFIMIIIACLLEAIFYYFISTNFRNAFDTYGEFNIIFGPIGLIISMSLFLISITILNIKSDFPKTTKKILVSILSISTIYILIFTIFNTYFNTYSGDVFSLFSGEHIITILIILLYSILVPLNMIFITTREIFKNKRDGVYCNI